MNSVSVLRRGIKEHYLHVFLTGSENHTEAVNSAELTGLKVCNKADLFTDKVGGCIEFSNSRDDLTLLIAEVDLKLQELLRLRNRLAFKNLGNTELNSRKGINSYFCLVLGLGDRLIMSQVTSLIISLTCFQMRHRR